MHCWTDPVTEPVARALTPEVGGDTYGAEAGLPRVPLPTLEDSCQRFLTWCAPLLSADELATTEREVAWFLQPGSPARRLQGELERFDDDDSVDSWLDAFWPYRYLGRRDRIALNANFFFLLEESPQGQLQRAAGLIAAMLHYKQQLDAEQIPPVVQQGRVLSMEQHRYLFSTARIPGPVQDTVRTPTGSTPARHVVVLIRGRLFRLDVVGSLEVPFALEELAAGLREIQAAATPAGSGSIGHLTTQARAQWARNRQSLLELHAGNAELLDVVETALFCVCLDDARPADAQAACDLLLHGDSGNRWFDKLCFVVFGDGTAGLNVEHAYLDGTTVLNVVDALLAEPAQDQSDRSGARSQGVPFWTALEPVLDADLRAEVATAAREFAAYAEDTTTAVLSFGFGVQRIKQLRMSPDAFAQLAYQLAHSRSRGMVGATYESIATRHFRHGRTEAMRVVTPEIVRFVAAMDDPAADGTTRGTALRAAAEAHVQRAKQCQAGRAPEQHLWELQLLQRRRGEQLGVPGPLALYDSPGWRIMREDYLSTSSAPSAHIQFFGFGPTTLRCIGIAYVLLPDRFHLYLSAKRALADQVARFADELTRAVAELQALLEAVPAVSEEPG